MKINHFDTSEEENSFLKRKQQRKDKIFHILFFSVFFIMIIGIFIFAMLDKIVSFISALKNAKGDEFIFVITATLICVALAFFINWIFNRKNRVKKFSFYNFHLAITAALGIMLIGGFLFMCIEIML